MTWTHTDVEIGARPVVARRETTDGTTVVTVALLNDDDTRTVVACYDSTGWAYVSTDMELLVESSGAKAIAERFYVDSTICARPAADVTAPMPTDPDTAEVVECGDRPCLRLRNLTVHCTVIRANGNMQVNYDPTHPADIAELLRFPPLHVTVVVVDPGLDGEVRVGSWSSSQYHSVTWGERFDILADWLNLWGVNDAE